MNIHLHDNINLSHLSRHFEVKRPNGGDKAWNNQRNDETLQHVQEQLARVAHVAEMNTCIFMIL